MGVNPDEVDTIVVEDDKSPIQEDEEVPDLEEPDDAQLELEKLEKTKEQKKKEWLADVIKETEASRDAQQMTSQDVEQTEAVADTQSEGEKSNIELD